MHAHKVRTVAAACTVGILLLAGCSDDSSPSADGSTSSTAAPVSSTTARPNSTGTTIDTGPDEFVRTTSTLAPGQPPPPSIPVQAEPSGDTPEQQAAAEVLAECALTDKECREVEAIQVEWPGAQITEIDLTFANLTGADLRGADLTFARMSGAILNGANLSRAHLSGADLSGADLTGANLAGADLSGADLRGAILTGAILDGADLTGVILCGTDMPDGALNNQGC